MVMPDHSNGVTLCLAELLLYQQQSVRWLPPARSLWSQLLGQHQSRRLGRGMDFAEVRHYQPGDDIRAIDWRVTARTGKTHTKLFCEEREKPVILYIDLSNSMQFGSVLLLKAVQAAHMASMVSWLAVANNDRIGAVIDTGQRLIELKPTSRKIGALQLLQNLVLNQNQIISQLKSESIKHNFQPGLFALNRLSPKGSEIILLSDFVGYREDDKLLLSQLRCHNQLRLIHIYDPLESGITAFRGSELVSDEQQDCWLNFAAPSTRDGIRQVFEQKHEQLQALSQSLGCGYYQLSCGQGLLEQLTGA